MGSLVSPVMRHHTTQQTIPPAYTLLQQNDVDAALVEYCSTMGSIKELGVRYAIVIN